MPKTVAHQCDQFIEKYADLVIAIIGTVPPKEVCTKINLCQEMNYQLTGTKLVNNEESWRYVKLFADEVIECGVCHGAVVAVSGIVSKPDFNDDTDKLSDEGCNSLPGQYYSKVKSEKKNFLMHIS